MGIPSQPASNAIIYLTLGAFLYVPVPPTTSRGTPTSPNQTYLCFPTTAHDCGIRM